MYGNPRDAIFELLEDCGAITDELKQMIEAEDSLELLKKWYKLAAKETDIQDFINKIQ